LYTLDDALDGFNVVWDAVDSVIDWRLTFVVKILVAKDTLLDACSSALSVSFLFCNAHWLIHPNM